MLLRILFEMLFFSACVFITAHVFDHEDCIENDDYSAQKSLRGSIVSMLLVHLYDIVRLIYTLVIGLNDDKAQATIIKYCVVDCYFVNVFLAYFFITFVYAYYIK